MARLDTEQNIWITTVRPDGSPHLTPIWFVWHGDRFWICTNGDSVKTRNAIGNPKVALSLESGKDPVVAEGSVELHARPYPDAVAAAFMAKFGWDITRLDDVDGPFDALWEITVDRWLMGGPS